MDAWTTNRQPPAPHSPAPTTAARLSAWSDPSAGAVAVRLAGVSGVATVVVYDGLGRRVAVVAEEETVASSTYEAALPVESLSPGIYLVRVERWGMDGSASVAVARLTVVR